LGTAGHLDKSDTPRPVGAGQSSGVRGEDQHVDVPRVEVEERVARWRLDYFDALISDESEQPAAGCERGGLPRRNGDFVDLLSRGHVPEADLQVVAGPHERLAVSRERDGLHADE